MRQQSNLEVPEEENPQEEPEVYAVYWQGGKAKISRRNLLKAGGVLMAGAALAGCASAEEETIEQEPTHSPVPTATLTPTPEPTRAMQDWNCNDAAAHENPIMGIKFTPDGRWMLSYGEDEPYMKLWSFPDSQEIRELDLGGTPVRSVIISPTGDYGYSLDEYGAVNVWALPDGQGVGAFSVPGLPAGPQRMYLSPDGHYMVVTVNEGEHFAVFEVPSGSLLYEKDQIGASWLSFEFSPNSGYFASFSSGSDATVWSLADGLEVVTLPSVNRFVHPSFSKDDLYFAFPNGQVIDIYSLPEGELVKSLAGHQAEITEHAMFKNTYQLITGDDDGVVKIWSIEDGVEEYSWQIDHVSNFSVNEELQTLAMADYDMKRVALYALMDGTEIENFTYEDGYAWAEFSPNNLFMYVVIRDYATDLNSIIMYDLQKQAVLNELNFDGFVMVAFNPDSRFLVVGDQQGKITLYSMEDGQEASCMVDLAISGEELEGIEYSVEENGRTVTYTLPCGSPIPAGAVCVCNCVAGSGCACVGHASCSCVGDVCSCVSDSGGCSVVYHYWYPN